MSWFMSQKYVESRRGHTSIMRKLWPISLMRLAPPTLPWIIFFSFFWKTNEINSCLLPLSHIVICSVLFQKTNWTESKVGNDFFFFLPIFKWMLWSKSCALMMVIEMLESAHCMLWKLGTNSKVLCWRSTQHHVCSSRAPATWVSTEFPPSEQAPGQAHRTRCVFGLKLSLLPKWSWFG